MSFIFLASASAAGLLIALIIDVTKSDSFITFFLSFVIFVRSALLISTILFAFTWIVIGALPASDTFTLSQFILVAVIPLVAVPPFVPVPPPPLPRPVFMRARNSFFS